MGGATTTVRFFTLLSSPLPLLRPRRASSLLYLRCLSARHSPLSLSSPPLLSPPKCSQHSHTHKLECSLSNGFSDPTRVSHPWHEWPEFVNRVSSSGYCNMPLDVRDFVGASELSDGFLWAASGCLAFARDHPNLLWSLSREDIEVVVENGSPFLFKNASSATTRMKSFLAGGINHVPETEKPSMVDLMKFLLSCVHGASVSSENMHIYSRVESSVRKLFGELAKSRRISAVSFASAQKQFPESCGQEPKSFGKNIQMKRGDWVCPRCSFMNFAKNQKCLLCEEPRANKFQTGGEWECPRCDFFNFSRNVVCLRCDCKKPGEHPFQSSTTVSDFTDETSSVKSDLEKRFAGTGGKEQSWFTKITQLEKSSDMSSALADDDLPKTMQSGTSRFAASPRNSGIDENSDGNNLQTADVDSSLTVKISQSLDGLLAQKPSSPYTSNNGSDFGENSRDSSPFEISISASSQYSGHLNVAKSSHDTYAPVHEQTSNEKPPRRIGDNDYERGKAEISERWSNKDSAISNDDFPESMPMRRGQNRFVVSKKKDRSLTSPMYKRRMAMEQASNTNYVPFVPFPPGYFAKDKPQEGTESSHPNQQTSSMNLNSGGAGERKEDKSTKPVFEASNSVDQNPNSQFSSSPDGYSKTESFTGRNSFDASPQSSENLSVGNPWRGRSLEGSAVKDPDPLDMSEEAKAERWFRRVAQIKDISELSQIPDEDFPSIMPMRKGVNRFVVSKRKTPLERRLASSQYRRNLPVVSSDPVEKETDLVDNAND